jgi:hypothetical protein
MLEINNKQLSQRFLKDQDTILAEEKAGTTNIESDSNQRLGQILYFFIVLINNI